MISGVFVRRASAAFRRRHSQPGTARPADLVGDGDPFPCQMADLRFKMS
jgi:hypothetical protein